MRYKTRSCTRSFANDMSPINDRASEIGGRGTRNIRASEATSSSTIGPRIYRELSQLFINIYKYQSLFRRWGRLIIPLTLLWAFTLKQYTYLSIGEGLSSSPDAVFTCTSGRNSISTNYWSTRHLPEYCINNNIHYYWNIIIFKFK
jgi:hypothetical protein